MILHQKTGAEVTRRFLVAHHGEDHIPRQCRILSLRAQKGGQHHRHASLHIEGAAPPDKSVRDSSLKGRIPPLLIRRCHHIHVAIEKKRGGVSPATQPGHQVRAIRGSGADGSLNPRVLKQFMNKSDAGTFVSGGIGRIEPEQALKQLHRTLIYRSSVFQCFHLLCPSLINRRHAALQATRSIRH